MRTILTLCDSDPVAPMERRRRRGMSLLEVMVTIAIILTVMSVLAFGVMSAFTNAQEQTTVLTMGKVSEALQIYVARKRRPPTSSEGLAVLYRGDTPPPDAWGNPLHYVSPGPDGQPYDLISFGADGQEGGGDDLRWSEAQ